LSLRAGVASPRKIIASSRKSNFVPQRRGNNTSNRPEVSAKANFLAKLSNKEIHLKMVLRLGLINLIVCPVGEAQKPSNCCKVSTDN
jgi:hypothetical protein